MSALSLVDKNRATLHDSAVQLIAGQSVTLPSVAVLQRVKWPAIPAVPSAVLPPQGLWHRPYKLIDLPQHPFIAKTDLYPGRVILSSLPIVVIGDPTLFSRAILVADDQRTPLKIEWWANDRDHFKPTPPDVSKNADEQAREAIEAEKRAWNPLHEWLHDIISDREATRLGPNTWTARRSCFAPGISATIRPSKRRTASA